MENLEFRATSNVFKFNYIFITSMLTGYTFHSKYISYNLCFTTPKCCWYQPSVFAVSGRNRRFIRLLVDCHRWLVECFARLFLHLYYNIAWFLQPKRQLLGLFPDIETHKQVPGLDCWVTHFEKAFWKTVTWNFACFFFFFKKYSAVALKVLQF